MTGWKRFLSAAAAAALFMGPGCTDSGKEVTPPSPEPPLITAITPDSAEVGRTVQVLGQRFGATKSASSVLFGAIPATTSMWSDVRIDAVVPQGATSGNVKVVVDGRASNEVLFKVIVPVPAPVITAIDPDSAEVGATVRVDGQHFGASRGSSLVFFGNLTAATSTWSDTRIDAVVPPGAISGNVKVIVSGRSSNEVPFTVIVPPPPPGPFIDRLIPARTVIADTVRVEGAHFGTDTAAGEVTMNGSAGRIAAATVSWSDTVVVVLVPEGAVDGPVRVRVGQTSSNDAEFSVAPVLISFVNDLILPLFTPKGCVDCHFGEGLANGNFRIDTVAHILLGNSDHGPVVVRRRSVESKIILKISLDNPPFGERMPLGCKTGGVCLTDEQILKVADWIDQGTRDN